MSRAKQIKHGLEGIRGFSCGKMTGLSIIVFFCFLLAYSTGNAQPISRAAMPCEVIVMDSVHSRYFGFDIFENKAQVFPKALNRRAVEKCIGREIEGPLKFGNRFRYMFSEIPPVAVYAFLVDEEGNIDRICHDEKSWLPGDQFQVMTCLEKLEFRPAKRDGENIAAVYFLEVNRR